MAKDNQCQRILHHLRDFGSITSIEAIQEYGCQRLAARIGELRKAGYDIVSEIVNGENRYGEPIHWAVYRLVEVTADA